MTLVSNNTSSRPLSNQQALHHQKSPSDIENQYQALLSAMSEGVLLQDSSGNLLSLNPAAEKILGYSFQASQMTSAFPWKLLAENGKPFSSDQQPWKVCLTCGHALTDQIMGLQMVGGSIIWIQANLQLISNGNIADKRFVLSVFKDITQQRIAEELIAREINQLQPLLEIIPNPYFAKDINGYYRACNQAFEEYLGIKRDQIIGRSVYDIAPKELADVYFEADKALFEKPGTQIYQTQVRWSDNSIRDVIFHKASLRANDGTVLGLSGLIVDITEQKKIEQSLRTQARLYRSLVEHSPDLIVRYNTDLRRTYVNPAWEKASGLSSDEVLNIEEKLPKVPQATSNEFVHALKQALETGTRQSIDFAWENAYGKTLSLQYVVVPELNEDSKVASLLAVGRDVTDLKHTQDALSSSESHLLSVNRALKTLSAANETLIRAHNEEDLLQRMCRVIVDIGGHKLASIGKAHIEQGQVVNIKTLAKAAGENVVTTACDCTNDCPAVIRAIQNDETIIIHDLLNDPMCVECGRHLQSCDIRSALIQPMRIEDQEPGSLSIYSANHSAFDNDEVVLLKELAADLAYGINSLHNRLAREHSMRHIQYTMEATVQALASTLEYRDPYTAGHQQRVGQLAQAIGRELGMDEDQLKGLYLAAIVHDIGKIRVPSEILTRPGRLSCLEMKMVKTHVEASFDILKPIDFPWPIAQIILQHHERLDGSGYPQGLKGDEMLFESRILAVADVVEAIASFRPYRPALGIEIALSEIEAGRGTLFDTRVVEACTHLFREKRYIIE